ncbi:unnamed protein product [Danaus chrysippus]|uniref:(African queen) hypothetical protein n=1 Tax=Danaus chrysippus TaxID=151541 RepID=A0A8J2M802_9NEOP|nr:unnamed protein product [Danaus chrysippus]
MDHIEVTNRTAPDPPPPPNVQPPLPLDPPPLDQKYILSVKQEIDDSKYENNSNEEVPDIQNRETVNGTNSTQQAPAEKTKVTICRDFIRGSCKRLGNCRYAHKYDLSQLVGVYTFCHDYQTSVCTYPNCKYVHATVFEEHHFYRTGVLPPHALAHLNKVNVNVVQPPPPPPPPPPQPQDVPNNFSHVPMNTPMMFTVPPPKLQNEISQVDLTNARTSKKTFLEHFGSSPSDRDTYEPFPKKCKHCDIMDFRLQYHKEEVEKMELARDQKIENTCLLERKKKKINALILTLFKLSSKNQNHSSDKETNHGGDKDKMLLEQLSSIFSVNGRMSALGEDE